MGHEAGDAFTKLHYPFCRFAICQMSTNPPLITDFKFEEK